MRILRLLPLILTVLLIWALNRPWGSLPPLGKIVDPINGALAAAEPVDGDWNKSLRLKELKEPVSIWMDTNLIPHIRANNDHDLYYAQGYIHAYFRLWQMDMQTRAAWGRISEVAGPKAIDFDRGMRREGMVWGARASLKAMEAEPRTKAMLDAYRDGINAYIHSLNYRRMPVEYKLMSFEPEDWTNLRTALLLKYMARDLTGKTDDIAYTLLRDKLGQEEFDFLFPERIKGSKQVIPEGTKFEAPSLQQPKAPEGDLWAHFEDTANALNTKAEGSPNLCHSRRESHMLSGELTDKTPCGNDKVAASSTSSEGNDPNAESAIGSNNWAISGKHTASGKPILCNDPHLALNLPSLWYEMQLTAPGINVYGASLPGAPGIVIGFNQKISWGFTNNYRDVKDFYEISTTNSFNPKKAGAARQPLTSYLFEGAPMPFQVTKEVIKVKGGVDVVDTVYYTIHGPVTYDPSFPDEAKSGKLLACTWMAHRGSNELLATYLLNRAGDYTSFTEAISHFECPAQNVAYADGAGNIAMWAQGRFINKWKSQGKYVMRGDDSTTLWGESIPMSENPHVLNPEQGYVVSANQQVTDSTCPYWYNQSYTEFRSWRINWELRSLLKEMKASTVNSDPKGASIEAIFNVGDLQNDTYSLLNATIEAVILDNLNPSQSVAFGEYGKHNLFNSPGDLSPENTKGTVLQILWYVLTKEIWQDNFQSVPTKFPSSEYTMDLILTDTASKYYDDIRTRPVETLRDIVQRTFAITTDSLNRLKHNASTLQRLNDSTTALQWYKVKNTSLTHLAKIPAFSYTGLKIGGWSNTINACTGTHGPSWRMIVEMDSIPKAYAIYPGGQSGNPFSRHYGDFIQQWVEGKYHAIQFFTASTTKNPLTYTWTLTP